MSTNLSFPLDFHREKLLLKQPRDLRLIIETNRKNLLTLWNQ